jgi:lipopolysaccharide transport system permease protein
VQLWLFASPIAYSSAIVPEQWRLVFSLNPMAGVVEGFRWALLGTGAPPPIDALALSAVVTVALLFVGFAYFRRVEQTFADII